VKNETKFTVESRKKLKSAGFNLGKVQKFRIVCKKMVWGGLKLGKIS
jgi:hypothetical protein